MALAINVINISPSAAVWLTDLFLENNGDNIWDQFIGFVLFMGFAGSKKNMNKNMPRFIL